VLLARGADPKVRNTDGETALHYAALAGDERSVQLLITAGADVRAAGCGKFTPLHNAVWRRHKAAATHLLNAGADPNAQTADGHTCLHLACLPSSASGAPASFDLIALLLSFDADVRIKELADGALPAHLLARAAPTRDLDVFLRACAQVEVALGPIGPLDDKGQTVLHHAAAWGNARAVELLLTWPRDMWPYVRVGQCTTAAGKTELHLAAASNSLECVKLLVEKGNVRADVPDADGKLPIDYSSTPAILQYLSQLVR
jgi:ankyrin repeat protein